MRIDLPQCNLKPCRHQFDGNCTCKTEYARCEYPKLRSMQLNAEACFTIVRPESGEWEAMYVNGQLACEGHSLDAERVIHSLYGGVRIVTISDEVAEAGMPELLYDLDGLVI